jgi:hypothetical protein
LPICHHRVQDSLAPWPKKKRRVQKATVGL